MSDAPVEVLFSDEFQRRLRTLAKRYRQIRADLQPVIEQLQGGSILGDQITGTNYIVFKVRIKNSDIRKGKSAGYRLIYQLASSSIVLLISIYSKSDQADIAVAEIQNVIEEFQQRHP